MKQTILFLFFTLCSLIGLKAQTVIGFESNVDNVTVLTGSTNGLNGCTPSYPLPLINGDFNQSIQNAPNADFHTTLVSSGPDDQVQTLAGECEDCNPISLQRTHSGNKALKINQNRGFPSPSIHDNNEVAIFKKQLKLINPQLSFWYAAALEYDLGHAGHKQAYFRAQLRCLDHNVTLGSHCYESGTAQSNVDVIENTTDFYNDKTLYVKGWEEIQFSAANHLNHTLELHFEVGDCNDSLHGAYAYVDDITFYGEEVINPCNNICELTPTINTIENQNNPCSFNLIAGNNLNCPDITYNWLIDGVSYPNQNSVALDFTTNGNHTVILTMEDENGNTCPNSASTSITTDDCDNSDCLNCNEISFTVIESPENCYEWIALFSDIDPNCYTGSIHWGDSMFGQQIDFNQSIISNLYDNLGDYSINITLTNTQTGEICSQSFPITVSCDEESPCEDICDTITEIIINDNGNCNYTFSNNIIDLEICENDTIEYRWYLESPTGNLSTFNTPTVNIDESILNENGLYKITFEWNYINQEGYTLCKKNTSIKKEFSCAKKGNKLNIKLFPNPSKQNSVLHFEGIDYKDVQNIQILDVFGNLKQTIIPKDNNFKLNKLNSGIYFIQIKTINGEVIKKKLIIE